MSAGGGKNDVPNRLKRQFALFNVPLPSVAAINGIFGKLVEGRFSADQFSPAVVKVCCVHMQHDDAMLIMEAL
jgi:dynein heavy chain